MSLLRDVGDDGDGLQVLEEGDHEGDPITVCRPTQECLAEE